MCTGSENLQTLGLYPAVGSNMAALLDSSWLPLGKISRDPDWENPAKLEHDHAVTNGITKSSSQACCRRLSCLPSPQARQVDHAVEMTVEGRERFVFHLLHVDQSDDDEVNPLMKLRLQSPPSRR